MKMATEDSHSKLPPYVSFKSFTKLIEGLRAFTPSQLDRSYLLNAAKFNGSTATAVLTACRFLKLVDGLKPAETLTTWLKQNDPESKKTFEKILRATYAPIFELDLETATDQMLRDAFRRAYGADGEVGAKCIVFFIHAAQQADIKLSTLITQRAKMAASTAARARGKKRGARMETDENGVTAPSPAPEVAAPPSNDPAQMEWAKFRVLVDKFPRFDPTWPDDLKARWFTAYEVFMKTNLGVKP